MEFFIDSFKSAILLALSLDPELFGIVWVSTKVSFTSTLLASLFDLPLGFLVAFKEFYGKWLLITCLNTLLALPTVVIGLFVYTFISRRGIFGPLDLLYTQKAIVIGQFILILPVVATLTIQTAWAVFKEARFAVIAAVIAAFGRVIAEVGISMILGGNAKGFTRTMTTAMALEYDKGEFVLAVALGIILMCISFLVNLLFNFFQGRSGTK